MKELYQALSGAMGQEQRLTQIANNLANINTVGFRQEKPVFTDYFNQATGTTGTPGTSNSPQAANPAQTVWPVLSSTYLDSTAGPMRNTGQPLDVAIRGDGFFSVQVPGQTGNFYTRAGNFTLNPQNQLATASGLPVLDAGGKPITLDLTKGAPAVGTDGTIRVGTAIVGQLGLVSFANPTLLQPYGQGLLQAPAGQQAQPVAAPKVQGGMLEDSNVNAVQSMTEMIETQRAYESHQKVMQAIDDLMEQRIQAAR